MAPSLEMLIRLSDRFHKSIEWILRGRELDPTTEQPNRGVEQRLAKNSPDAFDL
jgi:hypothetical protein